MVVLVYTYFVHIFVRWYISSTSRFSLLFVVCSSQHTELTMTNFHSLCVHLCTFSLLLIVATVPDANSVGNADGLVSCLLRSAVTNVTPMSASEYNNLFNFSAQNLRFTEPSVLKPGAIIVPQNKQQVQMSVKCAIQYGWAIRVRSGGHCYEGLSYTSDVPFVIIDLMKMSRVTVDLRSQTAWMEGGATLGELFSAIAEQSGTHAFSAGLCPTVGVGGHFSGGGLGAISRKYGLASDNVIDALLIDSAGNILNRTSMGEDVFWALRGGGGGSWGIVIEWKVKLVTVPPVVTVFTVSKTGRDQVTDAVYRWQYIGPFANEDLYLRVSINPSRTTKGQNDVKAAFRGLYLGRMEQLLKLINQTFPELGMVSQDCEEMSWIESVAYLQRVNRSQLLDRYYPDKISFKLKSDLVRTPISRSGLQGAWQILQEETGSSILFSPLGGIMDKISPSETPFPHRAGNLFDVQYKVRWSDRTMDAYYISWMRKLYAYMGSFMAKSPRPAYVNYLDLDLGTAVNGTSTVEEARAWGEKYFLGNFDRLVKVKSQIDPSNAFRNFQSIPVGRHEAKLYVSGE
eukprot:Gb_24405 [translate_table: standard]